MKFKFTGTLRPGARTRGRREEGISEWFEVEPGPGVSLGDLFGRMTVEHWLGEVEKAAQSCLAEYNIRGNSQHATDEAERRFGRATIPWFAAEMLRDARGWRDAHGRGDAKNAGWHAFHCGSAFTEWRIKIVAEHDAIERRRHKRARSKGGKTALARRRQAAGAWQRAAREEAARLRAQEPEKARNLKWLQETVRANLGLDRQPDTIGRIIGK